jgi:hypothetical protein
VTPEAEGREGEADARFASVVVSGWAFRSSGESLEVSGVAV